MGEHDAVSHRRLYGAMRSAGELHLLYRRGLEENLVGGTGPSTNTPTTLVYYAPLSSSGIGSWSISSAYPQALSSTSCVAYSGDVYCLGGYGITQLSNSSAYSSSISSSGASAWTATTPYPVPFDLSSCVSDFSDIYCIAGRVLRHKRLVDPEFGLLCGC